MALTQKPEIATLSHAHETEETWRRNSPVATPAQADTLPQAAEL